MKVVIFWFHYLENSRGKLDAKGKFFEFGFYHSTYCHTAKFSGILGRSVIYVISFLILGLGTLALFLFISYCIVLFFRYLIKVNCDCDLRQPQYIIISGILLILLFALMFR